MSGTIDELRTIILTDTHPIRRPIEGHFHQYRYRLSIPLTGREAPSAQPKSLGATLRSLDIAVTETVTDRVEDMDV